MKTQRLPVISRAAALLLLGTPLVATAQSILRSAGDYVLLGGSAITASGGAGTIVSGGDVALSPTGEGAITGFPPALVMDGQIRATSAATALARFDFITAANALAAMTPDQNLSGQDLGDLTLASGVYSFSTTAGHTGDLVLDAGGDNDAFWVFQVGSSLTTAAGASVTFINLGPDGGAGLGLFWNLGSTGTIGASNIVAGNYLVGTSISFGNLTTGAASVFAMAAISLDLTALDASGGPGGGDFTGGLRYDEGGVIVAVPEPATSAALFAVLALGAAVFSRRRARR